MGLLFLLGESFVFGAGEFIGILIGDVSGHLLHFGAGTFTRLLTLMNHTEEALLGLGFCGHFFLHYLSIIYANKRSLE